MDARMRGLLQNMQNMREVRSDGRGMPNGVIASLSLSLSLSLALGSMRRIFQFLVSSQGARTTSKNISFPGRN